MIAPTDPNGSMFRDAHDDLSLAFDLAPVGLCVSRERVIQNCNQTFAAMFGYSEHELSGQTLAVLYPTPQEFEIVGRRGAQVMRETGMYSDERIMRHRSGRLFWCHVAGRSMNKNQPFACAVWMFEDLSDKRPVSVQLTARERQIAQLLATGQSSKQIGKTLNISHRTVEAHRARLMRKLDAGSASEMIARLVGVF
jgi:PAS domain S-box-containing protein